MNKDFNKFARSVGVSSTSLHKYTNSMTPYIMEVSDQNISTMDVFSKLMLESRIIFLGTDIDDYVANIINAQMLYLNSEQALKNKKDDEKDIAIYINSGGGCVYSGNGILDVMDMVKSDLTIKTVNIGISASMSAVILSNGTKDYRYSLKRSRTMIHQPMSYSGGMSQASDIEISNKEINILKKELLETLAENSNQKYQKLKRDCDRDYWMSSSETLKYGLIDKIIK